jgi:hypothetical protein
VFKPPPQIAGVGGGLEVGGASARRESVGLCGGSESDFYEPLQRCQQHGVDFVIRASWNRRLAGAAGHLEPTLATAPVLWATWNCAPGPERLPVRSRWSDGVSGWIWMVRGVRPDGNRHC